MTENKLKIKYKILLSGNKRQLLYLKKLWYGFTGNNYYKYISMKKIY